MNLYFSWLVNKVCRSNIQYGFENNAIMLNALHDRIFTSDIFMDKNRVCDALELRERFKQETGHRVYRFESDDVSVLEVLVALSIRCEETIMGDGSKDNSYKWFWIMIDNLDIRGCNDTGYIEHVLDVFINRTYNYDGTGGALFHVEEPRKDMRKTEIWYQMCWYLNQVVV